MFPTYNWHTKSITLVMVLLGLVLLISLETGPATLAQSESAYIRQVRAFDTDNVGELSPVGLAFSPEANSFLVLEGATPHSSAVLTGTWITPVEDRTGTVSIGVAVAEPINSALDGKFGRFLLIDSASNELIEIKAGPEGTLDPTTLVRHDAGHFGLGNAQGMAVDAASGELFIVDNGGSQLVRVAPGPNGGFDAPVVSGMDLKAMGLEDVHGVAIDPVSGHIHVYNPGDQELVELTQSGQIVAGRDMSEFSLQTPQAMVFAPSGDQTDDPAQMSLYLADSGSEQWPGRMMEFSFVKPPKPLRFRSLTSIVGTSSLVRSIDTSLWIPSSPDPAGIVYMPPSTSLPNSLLISDSEVNEIDPCVPPPGTSPDPCFTGDNLFQSDLSGILVSTLTTIEFIDDPVPGRQTHSDEPTGVTLNPANNHLFFSDDNGARRIYELDPGADKLYDTPDDIVSQFNTGDFMCPDAEGVTYASTSGALFIACGANNEIYQVTPGANGIFDGVPPDGDDVATGFDTFGLGLTNPEGIAFNPDTNYLYVVGDSPLNTILEITTDGYLVQMIDISSANAKNPSGLAYGPSSQNPGEKNIYIAARGEDSGQVPGQNDGKVYEMTLPASPSSITFYAYTPMISGK